MREFRIYDKIEKKYVKNLAFYLLSGTGELYRDIGGVCVNLKKLNKDDFAIEYSTNQKDKNGTIIFAEDIFIAKDKNGHEYTPLPVYYDEEMMAFLDGSGDLFCEKIKNCEVEVIKTTHWTSTKGSVTCQKQH